MNVHLNNLLFNFFFLSWLFRADLALKISFYMLNSTGDPTQFRHFLRGILRGELNRVAWTNLGLPGWMEVCFERVT